MQYICLIYFDPAKVFAQTPEAAAAHAEVGPFQDRMREAGHLVMAQPLNLPEEAITIRVRDGKMSATDGPFMETKEALGGFMILGARDLNEAMRLASEIPHAKLGAIEIRPAIDFSKPRPVR
jgi:hypothetical protein